jgi:hypothetical protein
MLKSLTALAMISIAMPIGVASAQAPLLVGAATETMLRVGTEVPLSLMTELTTKNKKLRVGQRFEVETTEAIALNGRIVIPVGTPGVGEVTTVRNKGMWGKSGHFDIRLLYLRVGDRKIRLSGTADDKGVAGGWGAAAVSAIVFLPAGFFMTGTSALLPAGTVIKGFLAEDVPVAFADSEAPRAIMVPATAAVVSASTVQLAPELPARFGTGQNPAVIHIKSEPGVQSKKD